MPYKIHHYIAILLFLTPLSAIPLHTKQLSNKPFQLALSLPHSTKLNLRFSSHRWVSGGPCSRTDVECMNAQALIYVNEIRKKDKGYPALSMGTKSMLKNAVAHSRKMESKDKVFHQKLKTTPLGCKSFFSGENVAQNYISLNPSVVSDPAKTCVEALKNSPPHYENIISTFHKTTAMGIFIDDDDNIWCTQTFAVHSVYGGGKCARASLQRGSGRRPAPTPSPSPSPEPRKKGKKDEPMTSSTGHVFKNKFFDGSFGDGTDARFELQCSKNECSYCAQSINYCLSEEYSVEIDKNI